MQERVALAVHGAPEAGRAVLTAGQQALPVGAQAQPVDAPAVVRTDPQRRPAAPHRWPGVKRRCAWLERGAPASARGPGGARPGSGHRGGLGSPGAALLQRVEVRRGTRTLSLHRYPPVPQHRCRDSDEISPTQNLFGTSGRGVWAPLPQGAPTRSEANRRTREAERETIQSSLAPPQRPPPNLFPPTFRASRQPPPQDSLIVLREQTQKLAWSLVGDRFHVLLVRPSQLPRLGSVPCHSRCPCPQSPRREGGGPKSLEFWGTPDEGQELWSPESALPRKSRAHPEFCLGQAGEGWILAIGGWR